MPTQEAVTYGLQILDLEACNFDSTGFSQLSPVFFMTLYMFVPLIRAATQLLLVSFGALFYTTVLPLFVTFLLFVFSIQVLLT